MTFELHTDLQRDAITLGSFELCQVLLINDLAWPWFVLVPQRAGIVEAIDLDPPDYEQLWSESRVFSAALLNIFAGDKLNVAALGNMTPQLHVHHIVRYRSDPAWPRPVWGVQPMQPYSKAGLSEIREKISTFGLNGFVAAAGENR